MGDTRTVTVERLARDGPFRVGERYLAAPDDGAARVDGVIVSVAPTGPKHVNVTVQVTQD